MVPLASVSPASGGFTGLAAGCGVGGYWQSTKAGSGLGRIGAGVHEQREGLRPEPDREQRGAVRGSALRLEVRANRSDR